MEIARQHDCKTRDVPNPSLDSERLAERKLTDLFNLLMELRILVMPFMQSCLYLRCCGQALDPASLTICSAWDGLFRRPVK